MNCTLFADWLANVNAQMKKNNRKILLFLDNAPCHTINNDLSNVKVIFFPPNTTSKCQPLDQGIIHSFKCHYRQKLVKHIIAQCTAARTVDQITVTALDAIKWIDLSWKDVTETTIKNTFRAAGFVHSSPTMHLPTTNPDASIKTDPESNNCNDPLKQLDSLLAHIRIGGHQLTAAEFVNIDSSIPAFNAWDDDEHLKDLVQVNEDEEKEEEENVSVAEKPPNLSEVLEMMRKLHLFASIQQPQLHTLISELESQVMDIYLDSKVAKQSSITDYFENC
jgi:hypothetical protein